MAAGLTNGLRLRIFGELGGLEWDHDLPHQLKHYRLGEPSQIITSANGVSNPQGFVECFSEIYRRVANAIEAGVDPASTLPTLSYPSIQSGLTGVRFVKAAVDSAASNGAWSDV